MKWGTGTWDLNRWDVETYLLTLSETLELGDASKQTEYQRLSENIILSDDLFIPFKVLSENLLLNDSVSNRFIYKNLILLDNLELSDFVGLPYFISLNDLFWVHETGLEMAKARTLYETLNISDAEKLTSYNQKCLENLYISDGYHIDSHNLTLLESLNLDDIFHTSYQTLALSESLTLDDNLRNSKKTLFLTENLILDDAQSESFGTEGVLSIYVYDTVSGWTEVEGVEYFKVEKRLNQMSKFEMTMPQIESAQKLYIKEFAKVMLFSGHTLILKGRIQKVTYQTAYECKIEGFGMEAVILDKEYKNATASPDDPDRVQYDNVSAQTIANQLLSKNADGLTPWTMTPDSGGIFASDYGQISMRYEFANKLTALANLSDTIYYDWWVSQSLSYGTDYFNLASIKGNQTAPSATRTFEITGASANCEETDYEKDVTNVTNYIKIQGYGDGINQLKTSTYAGSHIYTTLSVNVSDSAVVIDLTDSGAFPASGTIRIAEEQITYTGNAANQLTGCVRGANGTTARAHRKGCYLEKYYPSTSPQVGSSIDVIGLMEMTLTYRDVRDLSTLELIASNELLRRMDPIERMTIIPNDPIATTENLETGDLIKIEDAESSISGNYRVITIIYENNYGVLDVSLEASNKSLTFIEQMQKEREKNQSLQKYMQGSTNIYSVNVQENADATHYLNMRFYIPAGVLAINKVSTNFKLADFRAYESTGTTTYNSTVSQIADAATSGLGQEISNSNWTTVNTLTISNTNCDGCFVNVCVDVWEILTDGGYEDSSGQFLWRVYDGYDYYPSSGGSNVLFGGMLWNDEGPFSGASGVWIPGNVKGRTLRLQVAWNFWGGVTTFGINSHLHYETFSRHTHDITFGIYEENLTGPSVDVYAGIDGGETLVGTYTSDQVDLDLTSKIPSGGGWYNIQFRPNKRMRIEGNAYVKCFIESTTEA